MLQSCHFDILLYPPCISVVRALKNSTGIRFELSPDAVPLSPFIYACVCVLLYYIPFVKGLASQCLQTEQWESGEGATKPVWAHIDLRKIRYRLQKTPDKIVGSANTFPSVYLENRPLKKCLFNLHRYLVTHLMGADLNNIVKCQKLTDDHVQFLIYQILRGLKVRLLKE